MGHIAFGVIDRGWNLLQVRPTTICPLSCIFCSVDAGPKSRWRRAEFTVKPKHLAAWVHEAAAVKGVRVEALIDGVGDPLSYPWIVQLVANLKRSPMVRSIALETHGATLTRRLVEQLEEAGLDRVNFSIETLDPEKARRLYQAPWYDLRRVLDAIEYLARETSIDLHVTPVWLPGVNDDEIPKIIEWALRIGAGKKWPPVTVQKYCKHKHGRKPPGIKEPTWSQFWQWLAKLEQKLGVRLHYTWEEWGMHPAPRVPEPFKKGDTIKAQIVAPGWLKGEATAVTLNGKRIITIAPARNLQPGDIIKARITQDKDGIYIAKPL